MKITKFALPFFVLISANIFAQNTNTTSINPKKDSIKTSEIKDDKPELSKEKSAKPYSYVEKMPEFTGGENQLMNFLKKNIKYPTDAKYKGIQGTVYITFKVTETGKIINAQVLRGIGGGCDEEALRVINLMPDWTPGKQDGKNVPVQFNLPLKFILQ